MGKTEVTLEKVSQVGVEFQLDLQCWVWRGSDLGDKNELRGKNRV